MNVKVSHMHNLSGVYTYLFFYAHTDHHSNMLNITSRLAVRLRQLPNWSIDWSDSQPQLSRESLTLDNFLPSEEDAGELKSRAVDYVKRFLVSEFEGLTDLKKLVECPNPFQTPKKCEVVPMIVLLKDEKYVFETIDILTQLSTDANLTGDTQVRSAI